MITIKLNSIILYYKNKTEAPLIAWLIYLYFLFDSDWPEREKQHKQIMKNQ